MYRTQTSNDENRSPRSRAPNVLKYVLGVVVCGLLLTGPFLLRLSSRKQAAPAPEVTARALQLNGGWGYKIEVNHKLYIYQDEIPCLSGKHLFPTRESAMAIARLVRNKIIQGKSPAVTRQDLEKVMPLPKRALN